MLYQSTHMRVPMSPRCGHFILLLRVLQYTRHKMYPRASNSKILSYSNAATREQCKSPKFLANFVRSRSQTHLLHSFVIILLHIILYMLFFSTPLHLSRMHWYLVSCPHARNQFPYNVLRVSTINTESGIIRCDKSCHINISVITWENSRNYDNEVARRVCNRTPGMQKDWAMACNSRSS